jgi:pentatricopeptide repeat protein
MQFQKSTIYEMLKEVYALMEKLEEICFFPDTRTYSILMSFHAQNDDIDEVLSYFKYRWVVKQFYMHFVLNT